MFELLRTKCFFCHRLRGTETANQLLVAQLWLLDQGRLVDAKNLKELIDQLLAQGDDASEDVKLRHQQLIDEQTGDTGAGLPSSRPQTSANCRSVRDFRSAVVSVFMKECQSKKTCPHCGGASRTLIQRHRTSIIALYTDSQFGLVFWGVLFHPRGVLSPAHAPHACAPCNPLGHVRMLSGC